MKKVVVITGSREGLGKEIATQVCKSHTVVLLARNENLLKSTAKRLGCDYRVCDVTKYGDIENTVGTIIKKYKKIDCLINNAGVWIEGELKDNNSTQIENVIKVNTLGTLFLTRAVVPYMQKMKSGLIINIISLAGLKAKAERSVYNASKWAITGFTKSLELELQPKGIRVTGIYPGLLQTQMFKKAGVNKNLDKGLHPKEVAKVAAMLINTKPDVYIPHIEIKNIRN